jgi:hypothetical protein
LSGGKNYPKVVFIHKDFGGLRADIIEMVLANLAADCIRNHVGHEVVKTTISPGFTKVGFFTLKRAVIVSNAQN